MLKKSQLLLLLLLWLLILLLYTMDIALKGQSNTNKWINTQENAMAMSKDEWTKVHLYFYKYMCVIIFIILCLNKFKNNTDKPLVPIILGKRNLNVRKALARWIMLGSRAEGGGDNEGGRDKRFDERKCNRIWKLFVHKKKAQNMTLRLKSECLRRYSSEEKTPFGKGMMKTLYLNIIVFTRWYFPGFGPDFISSSKHSL